MPTTASVRVTLANVATQEDLRETEDRIVSALTDAIGELKATVEQLKLSQNPQRLAELESALADERSKAADLAELEAKEDVAQNDELTAARAERDEARKATDSLLAEMNTAAAALGDVTEQLNAVGTAAEEPADAEVTDPDGDEPAAEVPGEPGQVESVDSDPAAPVEPVVDQDEVDANPDLPVGGQPAAETPVAEPLPDGGPTDASGNPVEGPNV